MMIFKKAIPRRTFLRGAGAALALPLLESMSPALAGSSSVADPALNRPQRLGFVYVPNGIIMDHWTPDSVGAQFDLKPTMEPFAAFRDQFTIITGLDHNNAEPLPGEGEVAPHERAGATFLTGVHPERQGRVGISIDQIVAKELGKHTQLASMELGLDGSDVVGQCERGWSCAYLHTLSWRSETNPLPTENQPRAVFERMFGDSDTTDPAERRDRIQKNRSLLDSVTEAASSMMAGLGARDRGKLSEFLDAIRDIERRIQTAEAETGRELPQFDRPAGIPASFDNHAKLMFDLQVLALQTDLTRVITFMMGREQADRTYREIGIADAHHPLTHHQNDPEKIAKVVRINTFHAQQFAYYLDKLRATRDGDGSLLDHSMILYGGCISDGNKHLHQNIPLMLAGGAGVKLRGGRHLKFPAGTPATNLFLTMLDKLNVPLDRFGDSTGRLNI
ncbi:MAG: DUF1552 domain-containing protein [Acidobacteria bacterium]|nr:DUF1552 domain-containing protein [Acidobacteriota bacterium]